VFAAIDDTAHADQIARLEARDVRAHRRDAAHDFVARNAGVERAVPLGAHLVQIRVAHAAVGDVDLHVVRARRAPGDLHRLEGQVARMGAIGFDSHDGIPVWFFAGAVTVAGHMPGEASPAGPDPVPFR